MTHALRDFIRAQMELRKMTQADLGRASGLSRSHLSKLLNDPRDRLPQLPTPETVSGLANGFNLPQGVVLAAAIEALGVGFTSDDFVYRLTDASNRELLSEVERRLGEATDGDLGRGGPLPPPTEGGPPELSIAARHGRRSRRRLDEDLATAGEESQDDPEGDG